MDRKSVKIDKQALRDLVESPKRCRSACHRLGLDYTDQGSLGLAISGLSQVANFQQDVTFEMTVPVEEAPVKMRSLPDYGDHMTLGNFLDCVWSGCFIDDDGFGEYATVSEASGIRVHPSDVPDNIDFS